MDFLTRERAVNPRWIITLLLTLALAAKAEVRVKDIGRLAGPSGVRLIGYGLVVGLDRTGDSQRSLFTNQSLVNMLERFGISVEGERVRAQNVAAVMVTADVPPYSRAGGRFDATASSLGDAKSLQGGVLLQTVMTDLAGNSWGVAGGPITIGGFNIETGLVAVRQNHPVVGRVPDGVTLHRDVSGTLPDSGRLVFTLRSGDFTTARRLAGAVNEHFQASIAAALDPVSVSIAVPDSFRVPGGEVAFISELEGLTFEPDQRAKVVMNERTGTIVIGANVSISTVAVSHGSLLISIKGMPVISQPPPLSSGATAVVPYQEITVEQAGTGVITIPGTTTVGDVAAALNRLGVLPRDMIAIFQALKKAGALQAELVVL